MHEDIIVNRSRFIKAALEAARTPTVSDKSTVDNDVQVAESDEVDCQSETDDEITWDDCESNSEGSQSGVATPSTEAASDAAEEESGENETSEEKSSEEDFSNCIAQKDTGVVTLPDEAPEVYATYIQLLYTDTLPIVKHIEKEISGASPDEIDKAEKEFKIALCRNVQKQYRMLGYLYVLAEKLGDVEAKCSVLSTMVEATQERSLLT